MRREAGAHQKSDRWRSQAGRVRIGVISDTHGSLDPQILELLAGVDHIIHAGDVGSGHVLQELSTVAGVTAVAGNTDTGLLTEYLPEEARGRVGDICFLVCHDKRQLVRRHSDPAREGIDLVVTGHTHEAFVDWIDGVLYLDPGAAGGSASMLRTIAIIEVDRDGLDPHILELDRDRSPEPGISESDIPEPGIAEPGVVSSGG